MNQLAFLYKHYFAVATSVAAADNDSAPDTVTVNNYIDTLLSFLAHLSRSDSVSLCDRVMSGVCRACVRPSRICLCRQ